VSIWDTIKNMLQPSNEAVVPNDLGQQLKQSLNNIQQRKAQGPKIQMPGVSMPGPWAQFNDNSLPKGPSNNLSRPQQQDPLQQIMQQLTQLMGQGPPDIQFQQTQLPSFDPNKFKGQATSIVNEQFNPIINEILGQQKTTQARAKTNQGMVGGIYNEMANQIGKDAAVTNKGYDTAQTQSQGLYKDEQSKIAAMYAADAAAQKAEAKRLGTEAFGTPDALAAQNADKNFAQEMGSQQMQSTNAAFEQQQQAAGQYNQAMQGAARSEGGEAQRDIISQLEDYMTSSNSSLAETRGQQAGSINDLMMQLAQGTYDRDVQNAQFGYQQQRDYIGDQNNLYDRQLEMKMNQLKMMQEATGASGSGAAEKLNPWQSVAQFSEQMQPGQGDDIVAALMGAMNERPEIFARSRNDEVPMNPALFAKLIGDSKSAGGLDQNSLRMAAQELYRLLYGS